MTPLAVEFVEPSRWRRWLPVVVLAGGAAAAAVLTLDALSKRDERMTLQAQRSTWRDQQRAMAAAAAMPASAPPYATQAWKIVKIQSFDIDAVLRMIEHARQPGVRVTSLEIDPEGERASLELEAGARVAMVAYLDDLNAGLERPRWILTRAQWATGTAKLAARVEYRP
ncbi:hypothetical protein V4F39_06955 [Aquincola sp. MAHUQ-54]|uniref:Uncharacterized protein n=1 Tax=Aquincola agrisoli TaxID=3119538 RepID=A0AAW9QG59_9BURK